MNKKTPCGREVEKKGENPYGTDEWEGCKDSEKCDEICECLMEPITPTQP